MRNYYSRIKVREEKHGTELKKKLLRDAVSKPNLESYISKWLNLNGGMTCFGTH